MVNELVNVLINVLVIVLVVVLVICFVFGSVCAYKARNQARSGLLWFCLGFLFSINALIALEISKVAKKEGHSQRLWSWLGVLFGLGALWSFLAGLNAERKEYDFDCWALIGFLFGFVGCIVSLFLPAPVKSVNYINPNKGVSNTDKPIFNNYAVQQQTNSHIVNKGLYKPTTVSSQQFWICKKCGCKNQLERMFCRDCGTYK